MIVTLRRHIRDTNARTVISHGHDQADQAGHRQRLRVQELRVRRFIASRPELLQVRNRGVEMVALVADLRRERGGRGRRFDLAFMGHLLGHDHVRSGVGVHQMLARLAGRAGLQRRQEEPHGVVHHIAHVVVRRARLQQGVAVLVASGEMQRLMVGGLVDIAADDPLALFADRSATS